MSAKKLYIKTYGCQMNVYDSMRMEDVMKPMGYNSSEVAEDADMVILNTCHIREKAAEKMYSDLGRLNKFKNKKISNGQKMIIAVAGCVGQAEGEEIFKRAPYVDVVVGPQSYQSLPDLVGKVHRDSGHAINLDFCDDKFDVLPEENAEQGASAMVSIQEGCDKFCTFCVVPYTRGAEYSRPVADIYRETLRTAMQGAVEINLLGQNVNAYHGVDADNEVWNLGQLIHHISKIDNVKRIRYSTSHPRDMHEELYKQHWENPKLMPFLNLPVQSGSNKILESMNRKHTRELYIRIIDKLRSKRPNMQFSTDLIVGFPNESDADFEDTMDLVQKIGYTQAYSFKYSPRPGTPGADMENQVDEKIKDTRLQALQSLILKQQKEFNLSFVDKEIEVLFDRTGNKKQEQLLGRSEFMQSVHVDKNKLKNPDSFLGKIVKVKIFKATASSLSCEILDA